jgi:hypothetical protein
LQFEISLFLVHFSFFNRQRLIARGTTSGKGREHPSRRASKANIVTFIGQMKLPDNVFSGMGLEHFETKIMAFMRESREITMHPYNADEFISMDELKGWINVVKQARQTLRHKLLREMREEGKEEVEKFEYRLKKYLYELKTHPHLRKHYKKAVALVSRYRNQHPPAACTREEFKEWENRKLTPAQVLSIIKRHILKQNEVP